MTARHHHYLSQCYLKGFTKGGSKKSKLTVVDFKEKKMFPTIPRNVGGIRDFNRVDVEGVDQNVVEKSYAEFEGKAAIALKNVQESLELEGKNKEYILNLIALLAVRSPEQRENTRQFTAQLAEKIMDLSLATKERWESQLAQMKADGYEPDGDLSYEDMKEFHESKRYKIEVVKERHIEMELFGVEAILPSLHDRNWLLIRSTDESGPFITTDHPVNLTWKEPDKVPPFYRYSPGFGLKGTHVYFPLSRNLSLLGEFEGKKGLIEATKHLVAVLNSKMLTFAFRQIYAPNINFFFLGRDRSIVDGSKIFKEIA
ncbi:MAG: hypothetical protein Kow0089_18720 [Desulfobulbaceae bacterium]